MVSLRNPRKVGVMRSVPATLLLLMLAACAADETPRPPDAATPPSGARGGRAGGHPNLACTFGDGALADAVKKGVDEALADEWMAEARYDAFAAKFGAPFPRLERAEERHADLLVQLLGSHAHAAPAKPVVEVAPVATVSEACAAALEAEKQNVALYDRLLAANPPEDAKCIYEHLRARSADRHIPSLERCRAGAP